MAKNIKMPQPTLVAFEKIIERCKDTFLKKNQDYGSSWRVYRLSSLTDKIFIKAKRIRTIQEKGTQKVEDNIESEFSAIINYCIIALIQSSLEMDKQVFSVEMLDFPLEEIMKLYEENVEHTQKLLRKKNHDYGEAWRDMRVSSMTDEILTKLLRIKQIENNAGKTQVSEGVESNYQDILNYAVFCLIKLQEEK